MNFASVAAKVMSQPKPKPNRQRFQSQICNIRDIRARLIGSAEAVEADERVRAVLVLDARQREGEQIAAAEEHDGDEAERAAGGR